MLSTPFKLAAIGTAIVGIAIPSASARDTLTIKIPRRSRLTPVQRLNREGVEAVKKQEYQKAAQLFYRAYLFDPSDPFTLNNMGYISELQGQLDRAETFYKLASEQGSDADIDMSNVDRLQGKPMKRAFEDLRQTPMRVNRMNVDAMSLLSKERAFEATALLKHALNLEPQNPFTLNNLGVASEAEGNYSGAVKYYEAAAASHISEPVVVTQNRKWAGKPVSEMAAANAARLQSWIKGTSPKAAEANLYNRRGVFAENENNQGEAKKDFLRAYSLDSDNPFSLNNRGYVAEMDGDLESAQFFYQKAQQARGADARVGMATSNLARGQSLSSVATDSVSKVDSALHQYERQRRVEKVPIELTPRNSAASGAPAATPPTPTPSKPDSSRRTH